MKRTFIFLQPSIVTNLEGEVPVNLKSTKFYPLAPLLAILGLGTSVTVHASTTGPTEGSSYVSIFPGASSSYRDSGSGAVTATMAGLTVGAASGSADMIVEPGVISATAHTSASGTGTNYIPGSPATSITSRALASNSGDFSDSLTITNAQYNGGQVSGSGYVWGHIGFTGSLDATATNGAQALANVGYNLDIPDAIPTNPHHVTAVSYSLDGSEKLTKGIYDSFVGYYIYYNSLVTANHYQINDIIPIAIPIVFGSDTGFKFLFNESASSTIQNTPNPASASADVNFGHTFKWLGITQVTFNSNGTQIPLSSFDLASASGANYRNAIALTAVPLPSAWLVMLAGLPLLFRRDLSR